VKLFRLRLFFARRKCSMPDERHFDIYICLTFEGARGKGIRGRGRVLQDVETGGEVFFVAFSDGNLIAKDIDSITSYVVDFINVHDIRTVHFEEGLADQFFFHVFQCAVGNIAFAGCDELNIIAHAFEEEDVVLLELDKLVFGLDEQEIVVGLGQRECRGGA